MSKIFENLRNFLTNDDDDENEDEYPREERAPKQPFSFANQRETIKRTEFNMTMPASLQVVLVRPEVFADTREIADHLKDNKTVVLNLEATSPEVTRRIIDFIGGVAYANNGNIKPVANNTFIIFPYNVNFVGEDLAAELENNGVVF